MLHSTALKERCNIKKKLRGATLKNVGFSKLDANQLLSLVKVRWPDTKRSLGSAPPVDTYDDSGRILLTAAHFKYLENVKFAIGALVDDCKTTLALEAGGEPSTRFPPEGLVEHCIRFAEIRTSCQINLQK